MNSKKTNSVKLKKYFLIVLLIFAIIPLFAADPTGLTAGVTKLKNFISGEAVMTICLIALVVEAIGVVAMNRQGADIQQIIGKFGPWFIGTIGILCANGIVDFFFNGFTLK